MAKLTWVAVFFLVTVGMFGCSAQTQTDLGGFTQEMVPRESKTCNDIRNNLEMMLFSTYKSSIPRHLLKQMLPGLAEPLLPMECVQSGGHSKWLLESTTATTAAAAADQGSKRVERQTGGFFMPPLTNVKDPGDHPPPGMFRDPMKDPGDRPPAAAVRIPQTFPAGWTVPRRPEARDMYTKPFRGRFYGDLLPPRRHKRSTDEEEDSDVALVRHKRANGEEEKKGPNFDSLVFNPFRFADVPDQRANAQMNPFTQMLLSSIHQFFSPRRQQRTNPLQRARTSAARRSQYGPRPNVMYGDAPGYRSTAVRSQAPVVQPPPVLAPIFTQPAVPAARPAPQPAPAQPTVVRSPANQAPAAQSNLVQPPVTSYLPTGVPSSGFASLLAPATSAQPRTYQPSLPQPLPAAPPQPASPGGMIFGDTLPTYGSTSIATSPSSRRVKRASDNSSPSDVVTFGDFSMPADTFHKLINPRDRYSDDSDRRGARRSYAHPPPPPRYYSRYNHVARRPLVYGSSPVLRQPALMYQRGYPFPSPFARARQAHLLNAQQRRLGLNANQIALARAQAARAAPRAAQAARLGVGAQGHTQGVGMLSYAQPLPLPMGAAQPLYGNHPAY